MKTTDEWIKDGTVEAVPETVSTPAVETAVVETPTTDAPTRDELTGRFIAAGDTPAVAVIEVPVIPSAVAAVAADAAEAQAVEEFLEARQGDKPYQFPKNVSLPWKRGNETGFTPVEEILKGYMMEKDYRIKTQQTAEERRQVAVERARVMAEKAAIDGEREQLRAAMIDPEKLEQYQQHYEQMRVNPVYKKFVEDALDKRVTQAELDVIRNEERDAGLQEAATNLTSFIRDTASQYNGVDPERVIATYRRGLISGEIPEITEQSVHQIFKAEAEYTGKILSPIQSEMAELKAQIATLSGAKAVEAHNAKTDTALAKNKAAPVLGALGNGTAVGTSNPPTQFKPFTSDTYSDKVREWSKRS